MAKSDPVDPNVPAGDEDPKLGDNRIRELAAAVAELLNVDHYMGTDGGAGTGYNEDAAGEHKKVTLRVASAPTVEANKGYVYAKDVSGKAELFYKDEDGNEIQLTAAGVFNIALLTGKTIATPTLTSPVINTAVSGSAFLDEDGLTSDSATKLASQQSIKAYIDAQIAALAFGAISNTDDDNNAMLKAHAYLANQDGFVTAVMSSSGANSISGYVHSSNDPAESGVLVQRNSCTIAGIQASVSFRVQKGQYFEITDGSSYNPGIYWFPVGTLIRCTDQD